jgi:tRNA modification GTPase
MEDLRNALTDVMGIVENLARTFAVGHALRDGVRVAIVGRPNVGKSSLFNRLVGLNRAIVTEIAGTTRDSISEPIVLGGFPVLLTDTAGIRDATDRIEEIGIERTQQAIADADLLIVVVDGAIEVSAEDREIVANVSSARNVIAINKCDLGIATELDGEFTGAANVVHVSALSGEGLDELVTAILEPFRAFDSDALGVLVTDSRHYDLLRRAVCSLEESDALLTQSSSEELVLVGLHNALRFLGEITGETTADEILGEIFSTFCIGK